MGDYFQHDSRLFDRASGAMVGVLDANGREQLLAQGAALSWKQSGRVSAPISTVDGAAGFGVFGTNQDRKIPVGLWQRGASRIEGTATIRKVGTGTGSFQVQLGPNNGSADANMFSGGANVTNTSFSATDPNEVTFGFVIAYATDGNFNIRLVRDREADGGNSYQLGEFTGTFSPLTDNYINFLVTGTAAGTTYQLIDWKLDFFP